MVRLWTAKNIKLQFDATLRDKKSSAEKSSVVKFILCFQKKVQIFLEVFKAIFGKRRKTDNITTTLCLPN